MTTAFMKIAREFEPSVVLPPNFREIWRRDFPYYDCVELLIEGPFDQSLPDGAEVWVLITTFPPPEKHFIWQWMTGQVGEARQCGLPIEMQLPHFPFRAKVAIDIDQ
jgi:hypothetical protein